jgi:hypothetical protein
MEVHLDKTSPFHHRPVQAMGSDGVGSSPSSTAFYMHDHGEVDSVCKRK